MECVTCDVIATGKLATHALYSKVSIHEAPEALHDMAFTSVTPLSPHLCSWLGPSPRARTSSDVARVRCVTRQRKVMLVLVLVLCWCWCWY